MRLTSSRAYTRPTPVPKMPPGLVELMEGLTRDVLKSNPTNVYEFCANHMEKLMVIRDGPPSQKPLTLDQKILIAQEKIRQRAKERREMYDKEIKLQVDKSNDEASDVDNIDASPTENLAAVNVKAPVHHEHDLEHASEVEISHDFHANKAEILSPNVSVMKIDAYKGENENSSPNASVVEIETREETHENSVDVDNKTVETITNVELKPEHEQIFGKVENDVMNAEPLKNAIEIVGQNSTESQLQTITETSDENSVTESTIVLPDITIGDERDVQKHTNIPQDFVQETQSDDLDKEENIVVVNAAEVQNVPGDQRVNTESNVPAVEEPEIGSVLLESSVSNADDNISDSIGGSEKDINNGKSIQLLENQNHLNINKTVEVPEIMNLQICTDIPETEKDAGDINIQKVEESSTIIDVSADAISKDGNPHLVITLDTASNSGDLLDIDSTHENPHKDGDVDPNQNMQVLETATENIATAGNETVPADPKINDAKVKDDKEPVVLADLNIIATDSGAGAAAKIENDEIKYEVETKEENLAEKCGNNSTEIVLQKSDSTENTNEDISMLESDLSKTDDESYQNNPNNMDLETAAVTIQKVFRSFMFKSRNSTFEDNPNDENNSIDDDNDKKEEYYAAANLNKERRPLGITRMDTVLQTVNEEKSLSLSTDDSSTLSSAATTIQAHVRGFLVRNRLNSSKTYSMNSLVNSHEALDTDTEQQKNKTVLNIHIVPEEGNYLSRDESLITSMDLSLDGSPPSSVNLHPLSYDLSERRKMLKREDAVQSVSPPSNNSGKLSEDSVKEVLINENGVLEGHLTEDKTIDTEDRSKDLDDEVNDVISSASTVTPTTVITISKSEDPIRSPRETTEETLQRKGSSLTKMSSDESDVITPFIPSPRSSEDASKLVHSGEFHDVVLPTKVSRSDTSVVRGE